MSLLTRTRTVLAKIETVYGTDSVPIGSANAMLIRNLTLTPLSATLVSRDLIRPYLGNSEQLLAEKFVKMDFEVEMVGSGVVGAKPAYDALLRACAFSSATTLQTSSIVSVSLTCTVTKAAHGYVVGDTVTISGCTDTHKNGMFLILTVPTANTFTFLGPTGTTDESPAAGAPKITSGVVYTPISTGFESVTMYYNVGGVLHRLTGCMGTFEISAAVKQIPVFKFNMTGIYNPPSDTVAPTVDFSSFMIPLLVNTANTPGFTLFGYSGLLESMTMNIANDVQYITLVGSESVKILDRKPAGSLVFEAPTIASKDFFSLVAANTEGAMTLSHGSVNGYKVNLSCPQVLLGNPTYQDSNGVQMLSAPFTAQPTSAGNDELSISIQ